MSQLGSKARGLTAVAVGWTIIGCLVGAAHGQTATKEPASAPPAPLERGYEKIPDGSWITATLQKLVDDGLAIQAEGTYYPPGTKRTYTRFMAAVCVARAMEHRQPAPSHTGGSARESTYLDPEDAAGLRRLIVEFAPELKKLGADLVAMQRQIEAMERALTAAKEPFTEVPRQHWASQSVDILYHAGIIMGYPPGTPDDSGD